VEDEWTDLEEWCWCELSLLLPLGLFNLLAAENQKLEKLMVHHRPFTGSLGEIPETESNTNTKWIIKWFFG